MKRDKEFFDKFLQDFEEDEVIDVDEFDMGYVPFTIERVHDGEILQLNEDNETYSFKNLTNTPPYSWGRLFRDERVDKSAFRPLGWVKIENLESAHKAFGK